MAGIDRLDIAGIRQIHPGHGYAHLDRCHDSIERGLDRRERTDRGLDRLWPAVQLDRQFRDNASVRDRGGPKTKMSHGASFQS